MACHAGTQHCDLVLWITLVGAPPAVTLVCMPRPPDECIVHCENDLFELWCELMGPGGFGRRSLWMIFIKDTGQMSRAIVPIDDIPAEPDVGFTSSLARVLEEIILPPIRSAAFLLSRPGPPCMLAGDRRWAQALRGAISPSLVPWPMHLATLDRVQIFAPDDLIPA